MNAVPSAFHLAHAPRKVKNHTNEIDPDFLKIEHDSPVHTPRVGQSKYTPLFSKLKIGSALVCEPSETGRVAQTLRKWLESTGKPYKVKQTAHCPDGRGRVWLLAK